MQVWRSRLTKLNQRQFGYSSLVLPCSRKALARQDFGELRRGAILVFDRLEWGAVQCWKFIAEANLPRAKIRPS
jgi:hypothetical protein